MSNVIPFPTPDDPESGLQPFLSSSTMADDTPSIDPGFAYRLAGEVGIAARARHRRRTSRLSGPMLASAALVALIIGGMFALISSPDRAPLIAPATAIESAQCDVPIRSESDLQNLAFISTISNLPTPKVQRFSSMDDRLGAMSPNEIAGDFVAVVEACIREGHHPLSISLFSTDFVRDTFLTKFNGGLPPERLDEWARSLAQPLTPQEQVQLLTAFDDLVAYSFTRDHRVYLTYKPDAGPILSPGLILVSPDERFFTGADPSTDYVVSATFEYAGDEFTPNALVGTSFGFLGYRAEEIKPTDPTPCIANSRIGSTSFWLVVNAENQAAAPSRAPVSLINFESIDAVEPTGSTPDVVAELSACVRFSHSPIDLTFFDDSYLVEIYSRLIVGLSNETTTLTTLSLPLDNMFDTQRLIDTLYSLIGARQYVSPDDPTRGYVALMSAADIDGFTPGFEVDFAPFNTPEMPNAQSWLATDEVILAPANEIEGRESLTMQDADFVSAPWTKLDPNQPWVEIEVATPVP